MNRQKYFRYHLPFVKISFNLLIQSNLIILSVVAAEHGPDVLSSDLAVENSSSISSEAELGMGTTLLSISYFEKQTNSEERGLYYYNPQGFLGAI